MGDSNNEDGSLLPDGPETPTMVEPSPLATIQIATTQFSEKMKLSALFIHIVKHGNIPLKESVPDDLLKASNKLFKLFGIE